ncbi:MFS transporter [Streptomyces rhizosphaericus]|uniref:MFS transporter n=1 Tax=Streptomyces rhizosphaericus TaxID=114699 RepID=UPI000A3BA89F|nr:MFS transporter [Streptomyces rhizosphaericus]
MPEVTSPEQPATQHPWRVLAVMRIGCFLSLLDGSIVNVAIPMLIHSMDASYDPVLWVFVPIVGPVLGGFLLAHLSWRWIFFINVPIGIATAVLALTFAPPMRSERRHRLDLVGAALATAGLSGVVFGLIEGERYDWAASPGRSASPRRGRETGRSVAGGSARPVHRQQHRRRT